MKVFVDTRLGQFGSTFSFDLSDSDQVLDIKKQIEMSQGIPVSIQKLFFKGVELVVDHHQLSTYRIVNNSRLILILRDDHVNNQKLHQSPYAVQGFVPSMTRSNYYQVPPSHATKSFTNQDLRMMSRRNRVLHQTQISPVPPSHAKASFFNQNHLGSNDGQVLHQTEESVLDSFSMDEFLERAPEPWTAQDIRKLQGFWPGTTGEKVNVRKNQDLLQREPPSLPSNTLGDFSFDEDLTNIQSYWPLRKAEEIINKNQVFPVLQSNSTEERINTQDFPVRVGSRNRMFQTQKSPQKLMRVIIMTPYGKPGSKYLVEVNASDNVEELRKDLETRQRKYPIDLPAKGYFFYHKQRVLEDDKSFLWNRVAHGDTIVIFPGPITHEDYHT